MRYTLTDNDLIRFWSKVEFATAQECWKWLGGHSNKRPMFWLNGRNVAAYRIAYSIARGDLPEGYKNVPDHECNHEWCINPWHLQVKTQRENVLRTNAITALNHRKTVCKRGHELVPWSKTGKHVGKGWRKCHICAMEQQRARRQLKRELAITS